MDVVIVPQFLCEQFLVVLTEPDRNQLQFMFQAIIV
jgi:hypothetical protein